MSGRPWITALFVLTVAVSSALLFILQPMCARMLLPYLGGSPSVWTTCMLFFQAGLLGGYVYAHASSRMDLRAHAVLHLALLAVACAFLPPVIGRPFLPENNDSPVLWLLARLLVTIGLKVNSRVYATVSDELRETGRHLLQRWKQFNGEIPLSESKPEGGTEPGD